jgi:endoglucanase
MPNTDHSVRFWNQAAIQFKSMPNVIFDLFNEPYPDRTSGNDAWRCFKDGGSCPGISFNVAGYQTLVDTVRMAGAKNVVMIGGLSYSNDLS